MTAKSAPVQTPRSRSASRLQHPRKSGNLTNAEKAKIAIQARDAYRHQLAMGRIEPGLDADTWRREQIQDITGLAGTTKIDRSHWRQVFGHFLMLSGREDEAFKFLLDPGQNLPTEAVVFRIREALRNHSLTPAEHLSGPHITEAWFLAAARQRTGRPSLAMDTLADRLDKPTLIGLLSHLKHHIRHREKPPISDPE